MHLKDSSQKLFDKLDNICYDNVSVDYCIRNCLSGYRNGTKLAQIL